MLNFTPVKYQVEESSIYIEQTNQDVFVVKEGERYLNEDLEWSNEPCQYNLGSAKQIIEDYFNQLD